MSKEFELAKETAVAAGRLIKKSLGRIKSLRYKGKINIVTDVDKKAEDLIISGLKKTFPDYGILSEERPEEEKGANKWIIDPLDGTTNFSRGFPFFSVSIALERAGKIVLGVVYDPMHEEFFSAEKDKGAFLNKRRIFVSKVREIDKTFLSTGFSYKFKEKKENNLENFKKFMLASLAVRRAGAATIDLCYVACGRFDGFWEMDLCPWDTAAASLIVSEAGGKITDFKGKKFNIYDNYTLASNGLIHNKMINLLTA